MIDKTTYQNEQGDLVPVTFTTGRLSKSNYPLRREEFCRLMATGDVDPLEAYCQVWNKPLTGAPGAQVAIWQSSASRLMADPQIKLRIDQLKTPVVRKVAKKFEYTLQRAFAQCDEAYNLARIADNPNAMLKAIELQGKFAKLLAEQIDVTHRIGLLDETSMEVLLAMKAQLEQKRQRNLKIIGGNGAAGQIDAATPPHTPALEAP